MLKKTKLALTALLVAGISTGAMADVAFAKSKKTHERQLRSAPVYLQERNDWGANPYQNWNGWTPPPAHAGGVG